MIGCVTNFPMKCPSRKAKGNPTMLSPKINTTGASGMTSTARRSTLPNNFAPVLGRVEAEHDRSHVAHQCCEAVCTDPDDDLHQCNLPTGIPLVQSMPCTQARADAKSLCSHT